MKKIDENVMSVLSTVKTEGPLAFLPGQLDRATYVKVDEVLKSLGGKWNRGKKAHVFSEDAASLIDNAIVLGQITTKKDTGFFPTPEPLAERLVAEAGVREGFVCLEPSAGSGNIVRALLAAGAGVVAIERDEKMRRDLSPMCVTLAYDDFMEIQDPKAEFDAIVMNPPFYKIGLGDHLDHTMLAFSLLKPESHLRSILPNSVVFRQDARHTAFRAWVEERGGSFEKLPDNTFRESGTGVSTVVLRMQTAA